MNGKVYFVSAPGRIKIGYTRNPERRLMQLRSNDLETLTSMGAIAGSRALEARLHDALNEYCIKGEWFLDCEAVRSVVEEALAGKFKFIDAPAIDEAPARSVERGSLDIMSVVRPALDELKRIAFEIEGRIARGEPIGDLARMALFLSQHVVGPGLHGRIAPEIAGGTSADQDRHH